MYSAQKQTYVLEKQGGYAVLARWITDWDCENETNWWYVIKDTPFDINTLKAKRRYEINKGKRYFEVKRIDPTEYSNQMFSVTQKAFLAWPVKYRPKIEENIFNSTLREWNKNIVYGAFERDTGILRAYSYLVEYDGHLEFSVLRACPDFEKKGINAAMVSAIVEDYNNRLGENFYINDGSRAIRHETYFQDYLEKYFGFRKVYCKLNICYRFPFGLIVRMLYPFRKIIDSNGRIMSMVHGVLQMEEIARNESPINENN